MGIEEASKFLKLKKSTLYQLVNRRKIPFYKRTKKATLQKGELIEWVEKERVHTIKELEVTIKPITIQGGGSYEKSY